MPKHYKLKPSVVQAELLTKENAEELQKWCGGQLSWRKDPFTDEAYPLIMVVGKHGLTAINPGYYIVQLEDGKFDRMTAREFEHQFEPVIREEPQEEQLFEPRVFAPGQNVFDLPRSPFQ